MSIRVRQCCRIHRAQDAFDALSDVSDLLKRAQEKIKFVVFHKDDDERRKEVVFHLKEYERNYKYAVNAISEISKFLNEDAMTDIA